MGLRSGTLMASLACLVIAPGIATAGCSSPERPTISLTTSPRIGLDTPGPGVGHAAADEPNSPSGPKPCAGGSCSGRPAVPDWPASSPPVRIGLWAILDFTTPLGSPTRAEATPDDGRIAPTRRATSVFHPPRPLPSHLVP
jgi:hypothetical protein